MYSPWQQPAPSSVHKLGVVVYVVVDTVRVVDKNARVDSVHGAVVVVVVPIELVVRIVSAGVVVSIASAVVVLTVMLPVTKFAGHSHRCPLGHGHAPTEHMHRMLDASPEGLFCVRVNSMEVPIPMGHPVQVWPDKRRKSEHFSPSKQARTLSNDPQAPMFSNIILQYQAFCSAQLMIVGTPLISLQAVSW